MELHELEVHAPRPSLTRSGPSYADFVDGKGSNHVSPSLCGSCGFKKIQVQGLGGWLTASVRQGRACPYQQPGHCLIRAQINSQRKPLMTRHVVLEGGRLLRHFADIALPDRSMLSWPEVACSSPPRWWSLLSGTLGHLEHRRWLEGFGWRKLGRASSWKLQHAHVR